MKTLLAAVPVTAIVAYVFISRRRALCAGREPKVAQAQAERANSSTVSEAPVEEGERRGEGVKAPKKCEDEKLQLSRPQLHWSYSAGGAPVLLGPGGMVDMQQRKVMSPNEKREMDLMLKYQGRGSRTVSGSFEAAKAKKAQKQTQRKKKEAEETAQVDASFQKMANELSVVELEAMILKPDGKAKKAKKPKGRKKKACEASPAEEVAEIPLVTELEVATEESEEIPPDVPVEVPVEEPAVAEVVEAVEVAEATIEGDIKSTEDTATASPVTPEPANVSEEEPMLQVRSRRGLRKRRRKALLEAEAKKAELAAAEKSAMEAAMVDADDSKFKEMVSEDAQDTTLAEDEPEDTRDAADDASSSDAKEPKSTEEEVKEEKIIDSPKDFTVKCSGSTGTEGTWHRTELTTRKKWADLVDSDDEPS